MPDNFNLTTLIGDKIGELKFYGQGAGNLPTGNAIVSDLIAICRQEPFDGIAYQRKAVRSLFVARRRLHPRTGSV